MRLYLTGRQILCCTNGHADITISSIGVEIALELSLTTGQTGLLPWMASSPLAMPRIFRHGSRPWPSIEHSPG